MTTCQWSHQKLVVQQQKDKLTELVETSQQDHQAVQGHEIPPM